MASTRAIGRAPHTCCRAPGAIDRSESRTPLLTFGPASDETVSITPTVRGILRRSVPKHWSSYGLAVIAGLAAAVGCGTDGGTGPAADYTLSLTPAALTIVRGLSGSTTVAISRTNFTGAVTLSLASAPVGVIRSFNPAAPTGTNATLTVSVGAAVAPGVYNLTVNGAATPGTRSTTLTLTVNASSGGSGITTVVAATEYSCALNASGQAYCWGGNGNGQLGATSSETCVDARLESSNPCSTRPLAVSGGLTLAMLSASYSYTSALSTSGALYWWGHGTTTPTPVAGGLTFAEVSASYSQTCGVTTSGAAYCGGNATTAPTPVPGGLTFATVSVGGLWARLWRDHERGGVLLGRQRLGPAGRRHNYRPARPHPGRRGAKVRHAERGLGVDLRDHHGRRGLLLGRKLLRGAGQRYYGESAHSDTGRRGIEVRLVERW